jgi:hypothetical protein
MERDSKNQNWKRYDENEFVALKKVNDSQNVSLEFINEVWFSLLLFNETFKFSIF